jgi:hypothetical protein
MFSVPLPQRYKPIFRRLPNWTAFGPVAPSDLEL